MHKKRKTKIKYALKTAMSNSWKPIRDIIPTMVIAATIVFQLIDIGFFDMIATYLKGLPILRYIPAQGLPVIVAWFASTGIFSPSVGTQIMILATLMEVCVTTTIIMMLYMFW